MPHPFGLVPVRTVFAQGLVRGIQHCVRDAASGLTAPPEQIAVSIGQAKLGVRELANRHVNVRALTRENPPELLWLHAEAVSLRILPDQPRLSPVVIPSTVNPHASGLSARPSGGVQGGS